jgi:hypothetical protein
VFAEECGFHLVAGVYAPASGSRARIFTCKRLGARFAVGCAPSRSVEMRAFVAMVLLRAMASNWSAPGSSMPQQAAYRVQSSGSVHRCRRAPAA